MKTKTTTTIFLLLALFFVPACAGIKARENVLLPRMEATWAAIAPDVERGIAALDGPTAAHYRAQAKELGEALAAGSVERVLATDWLGLQALALDGIQARVDAGQIGRGVAASLRERVRLFDEAYLKLGER